MTHAELLQKHADLAMREGGMYYSGEYLSRIAKVAESLEAENAKLRELCKTLYQLADESYVPFKSANCWMDDFAKAICAMRELGIEVNE